MVHGDIMAWLNSDDYYLPGTLKTIPEYYYKYPTAGAWVGGGRQVDPASGKTLWERMPPLTGFNDIINWKHHYLPQPSCFLNKEVLGKELYVNEAYRMQMDYDLWLRISRNHEIIPINQTLSVNYRHETAKTARNDLICRSLAEKWAILLEHGGIETATKDIERYLQGDLNLIYKLRNFTEKRILKLFRPLIRNLLRKLTPGKQ